MASLYQHFDADGELIPDAGLGFIEGVCLIAGTSVTIHQGSDNTGDTIAHIETVGEVFTLPCVEVNGGVYVDLEGASAEAVVYYR